MTERRHAKMADVLRRRQPDLTLVVEDVHDPHNVSAILRSADATGILNVHLLYTKEQFPKLGRKSSASASKWVGREFHRSVDKCYADLRKKGFIICATHLGAKSKSLYELDLTKKVALVFGNEHRGVSDEAARLADENFQIPMMGMIESLNVSVACAVSLYEALRQRSKAGKYEKPALNARQLKVLLENWAAK